MSSIEDAEDALNVLANKEADKRAKHGAQVHPHNEEDYGVMCGMADMYSQIIKYSAACMLHFVKHDISPRQDFERPSEDGLIVCHVLPGIGSSIVP